MREANIIMMIKTIDSYIYGTAFALVVFTRVTSRALATGQAWLLLFTFMKIEFDVFFVEPFDANLSVTLLI
jgi:hypothetical protein